ncbi:unnamed protein product [Heterobilharzia americana]|nr:unnamed protein product [Heterobilharzia americana]
MISRASNVFSVTRHHISSSAIVFNFSVRNVVACRLSPGATCVVNWRCKTGYPKFVSSDKIPRVQPLWTLPSRLHFHGSSDTELKPDSEQKLVSANELRVFILIDIIHLMPLIFLCLCISVYFT